jgi:FkbM family methyltransferase
MAIKRVLSAMPEPLLELGRAAQDINYRHELFAGKRDKRSVAFRSYHLITPPRDELLFEMLARASSGETVYDVGANVGHYSLPLGAKGCFVYAFEPHPTAFERLTKNIRANSGAEIDARHCGLAGEEGTFPFYVSAVSTRSSFDRQSAASGTGRIVDTRPVDVTSLDTLVFEEGLRPPDHVKIDVEGLGHAVLSGARRTLTEHGPTVYLEHHLRSDEHAEREATLQSVFEEANYEIEAVGARYWVCTPEE